MSTNLEVAQSRIELHLTKELFQEILHLLANAEPPLMGNQETLDLIQKLPTPHLNTVVIQILEPLSTKTGQGT